MRKSFFSFLLAGLLLASFAPSADAQDTNKKQNKRNKSTMQSDTSSSRRIDHNTNQPKLQKTDSLPIPKPTPVPVPIPRPDTMGRPVPR
jgi:hypothetical protein